VQVDAESESGPVPVLVSAKNRTMMRHWNREYSSSVGDPFLLLGQLRTLGSQGFNKSSREILIYLYYNNDYLILT
jgi:hypothetical protein